MVHRDLKLENLLLDNAGHLNIADFGQAAIFMEGWDMFSTGLVGSLYHIAPEQIGGSAYSGEKRDIWSLGIILFHMIVGKPPFYENDTGSLFKKIQTAEFSFPSNCPLSSAVKNLISSILMVNPDDRKCLKDIAAHSWLKGAMGEPELARTNLYVRGNEEEVWSSLGEALAKKEIVSVPPLLNGPAIPPHVEVRCHYVKQDLKFSVEYHQNESLHPSDDTRNFLCFTLMDGECFSFQEIVNFVRSQFNRKGTGIVRLISKEDVPIVSSPTDSSDEKDIKGEEKGSASAKGVPETPRHKRKDKHEVEGGDGKEKLNAHKKPSRHESNVATLLDSAKRKDETEKDKDHRKSENRKPSELRDEEKKDSTYRDDKKIDKDEEEERGRERSRKSEKLEKLPRKSFRRELNESHEDEKDFDVRIRSHREKKEKVPDHSSPLAKRNRLPTERPSSPHYEQNVFHNDHLSFQLDGIQHYLREQTTLLQEIQAELRRKENEKRIQREGAGRECSDRERCSSVHSRKSKARSLASITPLPDSLDTCDSAAVLHNTLAEVGLQTFSFS